MNTLHPNHTAQIIPFRAPSSGGWKARARVKRAERQGRAREAEQDPNMKESVRNHRFRQARRDAWRDADGLTHFARARMDWHSALQCAQSWNVPGSAEYPKSNDPQNRGEEVTAWRIALVQQMLTPSPDVAAVNWKKVQLRAGQHHHVGIKDAKLQRAIEKDEEWLKAHPSRKSVAATRQSNSEARARNREFKEAMRPRIKDIAASRDLSDEDIRGAMTCKHHEIAKFTETHGVSVEWLLEGKGRIFKKDPITLSPNMTGSEFAAVVRTLPADGQRAIEAKIREIMEERQP